MKKLIGFIFSISVCAMAQGPGLAAWWDSPIVRNMNLTDAQRKQIRATVQEYRDQLIQQRADLQKAEGRLNDLMNEDQVNEAGATEAIEKVVAARTAMMKTVSMMSLKMREVLTLQQWQELQRRHGLQRPGMGRGRAFDRGAGFGRQPGGPRNPGGPNRAPGPPPAAPAQP